ncbi:MAG: hypothetical protein ACE14P_09030 [Methanotrichaceae archaeon]
MIIVLIIMMLAETGPSLAFHESGKLGPYVVSFDMNTTSQYKVIVDPPTSGATSDGVKFTRYYLSVDGGDGYASIILTGYEKNMSAGIDANREVVASALEAIKGTDSKIYPTTVGVDGQQAVLGSCKYPTGEAIFIASYSPDSTPVNGAYIGKTDCRFVSTYSWEVTRNMLGTLHIEVPG